MGSIFLPRTTNLTKHVFCFPSSSWSPLSHSRVHGFPLPQLVVDDCIYSSLPADQTVTTGSFRDPLCESLKHKQKLFQCIITQGNKNLQEHTLLQGGRRPQQSLGPETSTEEMQAEGATTSPSAHLLLNQTSPQAQATQQHTPCLRATCHWLVTASNTAPVALKVFKVMNKESIGSVKTSQPLVLSRDPSLHPHPPWRHILICLGDCTGYSQTRNHAKS